MSNPANFDDVVTPRRSVGNFVSLYAGAGGLDIGFTLAGFTPVWVNEIDKFAAATHANVLDELGERLPHLAGSQHQLVVADVLGVDDTSLPPASDVDLVVGGPPCQGFSVAGKMDPEDERSKHVYHFFEVVERLRPRAFVMENVKALYANRRWEGTRLALRERATELGYNAEMFLLNASHFGVPQARERMFFVGILEELGTPEAPAASTAAAPPTLRDALSGLPRFGEPGNDSRCTAKITLAKEPVLRRSPYAGMLFNGAGRPMNLDAPSLTLPASMGGNKTPIVDQALLDGEADESWVIGYHRALWDGASESARPFPESLRRITVEEAAAIQTFPDWVRWEGPQSAKYRQIGNAVPPRLGLAVAEAVKLSLGLD